LAQALGSLAAMLALHLLLLAEAALPQFLQDDDHDIARHLHDHDAHGGKPCGEEWCPCGCEKDEADHPFTIDCAGTQAIRDAGVTIQGCGTPSEANCKGKLEAGDNTCQTAFFILQAHHDYCDHDTLTTAEEVLVHDWEAHCIQCKIHRKHDANLEMCPKVVCSEPAAAEEAFAVLNSTCTKGETGSCCGDALTRGAFATIIAYHDLCDHDDIPHEVEEAVHDFEHPCEDHMCNFEGPDYDGTACPSDSSSAMVNVVLAAGAFLLTSDYL